MGLQLNPEQCSLNVSFGFYEHTVAERREVSLFPPVSSQPCVVLLLWAVMLVIVCRAASFAFQAAEVISQSDGAQCTYHNKLHLCAFTLVTLLDLPERAQWLKSLLCNPTEVWRRAGLACLCYSPSGNSLRSINSVKGYFNSRTRISSRCPACCKNVWVHDAHLYRVGEQAGNENATNDLCKVTHCTNLRWSAATMWCHSDSNPFDSITAKLDQCETTYVTKITTISQKGLIWIKALV